MSSRLRRLFSFAVAAMLMIPAAVGLTIPPGMKVFVYSKDQWEKLQKKEKIDETQVVQQSLVFTMCHQNGCTAENEATPQLVKAMKEGAAMVALAIHVTGRPVSFEVPLTGFNGTLDGKPVDNELYKQQRGQLWEQIKANQLDQLKTYQQQLQTPGPVPLGVRPERGGGETDRARDLHHFARTQIRRELLGDGVPGPIGPVIGRDQRVIEIEQNGFG